MSNALIQIEKEFQTSVNIGFDLNNKKKIKSLIPTGEAIRLLEDIILSTDENSTRRARFLVGAYGKGKSHIVLVILSMLFSKDISIYKRLLEKVKVYKPELYEYILNYMHSDKKILPVVIDGNSNSMTQSFLGALRKSLQHHNLQDVMPDTHFKAAVHMIQVWKESYPSTYIQLQKNASQPISVFVNRLNAFDVKTYDEFKKIYPRLTSGSEFNPFSGFSVIDIYESVNQKLAEKGYSGIYVVYDEFSKYLESNITSVSAGDVKMLQDFAEKCCRSGKQQLHLLLIMHKEIENYIDKLPKQKVDGWRGVSERFAHISMYNSYEETYEIISQAIHKDEHPWDDFLKSHQHEFADMENLYSQSQMFKECSDADRNSIIYGTYPLHPVTTFLLPRLSEKVAQNERTMFTFLAGDDLNTLSYFLQRNESAFPLATPDVLYDYFAPQMRRAVYTTELYQSYKLADRILESYELSNLEKQIVKTISLIYIIGQFERLSPTVDTLMNIFIQCDRNAVQEAIHHLIQEKCVVYLKRSNAYLKLKDSSGVNISEEIQKVMAKRSAMTTAQILNQANAEPYCYPNRYNDDHNMVRYFSFCFVDEKDLERLPEDTEADGMIYGILPSASEEKSTISEKVKAISGEKNRSIFVVPQNAKDIEGLCREYDAVSILLESAAEDPALYDDYEVDYQDTAEVIHKFVAGFMHPEYGAVDYYYKGEKQPLFRKSNLTELMSSICEEIYFRTPIINNEMLNKNHLTAVAIHSREKLLHGLLSNLHTPNLGLTGSGQEVSFLRSALVNTGILENISTMPTINLLPTDEKVRNVLQEIKTFIEKTRNGKSAPVSTLYEKLVGPAGGIGMRRGVIPIFLAAVLKTYQGHVILCEQRQEVLLNADVLQRMDKSPEHFTIQVEDWNQEKEAYIGYLSTLFDEYMSEHSTPDGYVDVVRAMNYWYLSLPKYVKEIKKGYEGQGQLRPIESEKIKFMALMRQSGLGAQRILFEKLPQCFGQKALSDELFGYVQDTKQFFDSLTNALETKLISETKALLCPMGDSRASLTSSYQMWENQVPSFAKEYLYPNGAERLFSLSSLETNNEYLFIEKMALALTGLQIKDWNDDTVLQFLDKLTLFISTIDEYVKEHKAVKSTNPKEEASLTDSYELLFLNENGQPQRKKFKKVSYSKRAKLLLNDIENAMDEMGQSITPQEKRQVLMDLLEGLL